MKKITLILLAALLNVCSATAVPAYPGLRKVTQPDGSVVTLRVVGDEYLNFKTTSDGYTVVRDDKGYYVYAALEEGRLVATTQRAHDAEARSTAETSFLATTPKRLAPAMNEETTKEQVAETARRLRTQAARRTPAEDWANFRGLIILVEFNDREFSRPDYAQLLDDMVNQPDYKGYESDNGFQQYTGSVRDYYSDNSMGMFEPQFDVVGPVQIDRSQYFPGPDDEMKFYNSQVMFREALAAADSLVNYKDYDADGNGTVDMVFFIVAGLGAHYGNDASLVWPHASAFWNAPRRDGMRFGRYACSTELAGTEDYNFIDGIGTICHEFTHVLGLMDLYDTDYAGSGGEADHPGVWSLMAGGSYLNNSRTPCGYTLYERYAMGFATPPTISSTGSLTLNAIGSSNEGYKLPSARKKEFFLIENRQQAGWDRYLPGHGMVVYRCDSTNTSIWESNSVNCNPKHTYFTLLRATDMGYDSSGDPFPGSGNKHELSNYTTPDLHTWNGLFNDLVLQNIQESNGVITFDVEEHQEYETVEDFEGIDVTEGDTTVVGKYCDWQLIKTFIATPGEGNCNGEKAVAMSGMTCLRSTLFPETAQVNRIMLTVFNPTSSNGQLQAYKSVDGSRWTEMKPVNTSSTTLAKGESTFLMYDTNWTGPTAFQFIERKMKTDEYVYLDDVTFVFDPSADLTGIAAVEQEHTSGPAVYYDLSGRRQPEGQLKPGLYIVRQGNKATKVVKR